jgi:5'-nucleotidase / UDP-sugar diphosphatase
MKNFAIVALLVALSVSAVSAQSVSTTIPDIRAGLVPANSQVDILGGSAIVTVVRYNGFAATDLAAGPYSAIWVYTGGAPTVVAGDIIDIVNGEYKEYYDLSEIDMGTFAGTVTVVGSGVVPALPMTLADVLLDPEAWESHVLTVTDGFTISALGSYGTWTADSYGTGLSLAFDDYFYDETGLLLGDCYLGVTGLYTYSFGAYTMNPLVDGLTVVDCTVGNEVMNFGELKSSYR